MISDSMAAIIVALVFTYYVLMCHEIRIWRIVGCILFMIIGLSTGAILDTVIGYVLFGVTVVIGGIQFTEEVGSLVS